MASVKVRFVNFDRSLALETYTEKHLQGLMRRIDRRPGENKSIEVQFRLDAKAPFGSIKNSEVMLSYRYPGLKKILHVKRQGADLRRVLLDAIDHMEGIIRRETEKAEGGRRTMGRSKRTVRAQRRSNSESRTL